MSMYASHHIDYIFSITSHWKIPSHVTKNVLGIGITKTVTIKQERLPVYEKM